MGTDDKNKNGKTNRTSAGEWYEVDGIKYLVLGASGMCEDEEGNMYPVEEIFGSDEDVQSSDSFKNFGGSGQLNDPTNPAYWYYYYDERYCGPSREAYMEKMAAKARREKMTAKARQEKMGGRNEQDGAAHKVAPSVGASAEEEEFLLVSKEIRMQIDREQQVIERHGYHPVYHVYDSDWSFAGIKDREGRVLVDDKKYEKAGEFMNGRALVMERKTGKFGFIDYEGKEVIPCRWRSVGSFSQYLAAVQDDHRKVGYIDVTGRLVFPCNWVEGWPFHEGFARVQDNNRRIGMLNQQGRIAIPCYWKGMGDFSEGLAGVQDDNNKCGYIDKTGRVVIPCQWKNAWVFCEGRAAVQDFNKRVGFIDKTGRLAVPCIWKRAEFFNNGRAKVAKSRNFFLKWKWQYIDKEGNVTGDA